MSTIRWNLAKSIDTDQSLHLFLAKLEGCREGDLSRFIEEAVRAHLLELTAEQAKAANAHVNEVDLTAMIEESLSVARHGHRIFPRSSV